MRIFGRITIVRIVKFSWILEKTAEMDTVAHSLEKCLKNADGNTDPEIEFSNGIFANGGTKLIKYYYDSNGNLIRKSRAKKVRICEFDQDGQLLDEKNIEITGDINSIYRLTLL